MVTDASLAYGLVVMFFSSMLCSSAGVGGGSLNVPILYTIIGFDFDTAVILSLCALMGNYLLQVLINLDKRHPSDPSAPLIYWDAVLVMLPAELGGANLGVILAKAMPKTIIYVLAMTVLVIAVFFTTKKGLKLHHYETISIQEELEADEKGDYDEQLSENGSSYSTLDSKVMKSSSNNTTTPLLSDSMKLADLHSDASSELNWPTMVRKANHARKQPKITIASIIPSYLCCYYRCCTGDAAVPKKTPGTALRTHSMGDSEPSEYAFTDTTEAIEEDLPPVILPWTIIFVIIAVFVLYLVCYVVQKQYNQCSLGNYICLAIIYILLLIQVLWGLRYLIQRADTKRIGPSTQLQGEIHWGTQSLIVPLVSFAIGITSALLGIGGGELMGPMLLLLRVLAPVSTATTSFMSFLNTSASVAHYLVLGEVPFGYGAAVFAVGALGGVTGRVLALFFVAHYKRASILVLSLVSVLACSIFIYMVYLIDSKLDFTLSSVCSS